jgi:DtxR family Mn-dependent transcriptional regulator
MGVRLTAAGEKLAALVLRRHRLVELFLVKILGMDWTEVHDEAERLEHAVSERVIDRIDEMLGRPAVDPHGDPIPTAEGTIKATTHLDLLGAPLETPLRVSRVIDQDPAFLRFAEQTRLVPGTELRVVSRDDLADAVQLSIDGQTTTIGTRAAAKVLVQPT